MMKIPVIKGVIERRILINFTMEPQAVQALLPPGFRPKTHNGKAVAGVCLIRLKHVRPKGLPGFMGISSENGAHRIAVEWEENGETKEGVYVPRRDTSSKLNVFLGGRFFPGVHHLADFKVREKDGHYNVSFQSSDDTGISIKAKTTDRFPENSVFGNLAEASAFFEKGCVGYSPNGGRYEGLRLHTFHWDVQPLEVSHVQSTFFEQETFRNGDLRFDNALLMTNIAHEWRGEKDRR